jgi:hypothetical protein
MALATKQNRADAFYALDKGISRALAARLRRFSRAQARRVVTAYRMDPTATAEELLPESERRDLWLAIQPFVLQATLNAAEVAGEMVGLPAFSLQPQATMALLADAQRHVDEAHDTTLKAVRACIADDDVLGVDLTAGDLHHAVIQPHRSQTIAQTEIANARQLAALERYQEARLSAVDVVDEPGCGWTSHEDPNKANGPVRLLHDARAQPLSHPNCRRVFLPAR